RIKRVPVIRDNRVVGIVSRANLLRGLARLADAAPAVTANDLAIREQILAELDAQAWGRRAPIDVTAERNRATLGVPCLMVEGRRHCALRPRTCRVSKT